MMLLLIYFNTGEWEIPPDYKTKLTDLLKNYDGKRNVRLVFVGHTDSDPVFGKLAVDLSAEVEAAGGE